MRIHQALGKFFGLWIVALLIQSPQSAWSCPDQRRADAGGGHDVPTPFDTTNQRFELADGEIYEFSGQVVLVPSPLDNSLQTRAYFVVDLNSFPQIASAKRKHAPYYLLEGNLKQWRPLDRVGIKRFLCKAHGRVVYNGIRPQYVISLESLLD